MHVFKFVCVYVYMRLCIIYYMYVCAVCIHVCAYACMCLHIHIYITMDMPTGVRIFCRQSFISTLQTAFCKNQHAIHVCLLLYVSTYACKVYTRTNTYIHTHTDTLVRLQNVGPTFVVHLIMYMLDYVYAWLSVLTVFLSMAVLHERVPTQNNTQIHMLRIKRDASSYMHTCIRTDMQCIMYTVCFHMYV